ncbi:type IX secretion system ring protein PorN/GldN [Fibrella aquatilis]|uniref:Gliding motility protein GldN n=1 Tax=Fibrella aquatilis TaxID=2817059 RepID=A0A939G3J9_9BACT|nr:gliding motility protein GldN [Fibrella aquatilis]MBO0929969.1 gliding motility protein GldN [Fibrella aquatilis]
MQHFIAMKQVTLTRSVLLTATAFLAAAGTTVMAQERDNRKANSMSVRPIDDSDIMMKKTLWRRIDLKETQNASMFSKNNEITKYLMDAVKAGLLDAYENDSCTRKVDPSKFHERLLVPNQDGGLSKEEIEAGFGKTDAGAGGKDDGWGNPTKQDPKKPAAKKPADDGWGTPAPKAAAKPADDGWGTPAKKVATTKKGKKGAKTTQPVVAKVDTVAAPVSSTAPTFSGDERFAKEFSILEVKEDWIFDKKRSRLYYDIQTVTMLLPSDKNVAGFEVPVASFKYKDLDKLFRSDPKKFIWYNPQNQAQHKNLADAFDLRLFYGRITKVANPEDKELVGLYGSDKEGLLKSYQKEYELMELEHGLWEY